MKRHKYTFDELQKVVAGLTSNEEGFVVMMLDGRRCKIKGEQYLILHKAKFGLTPLSVHLALSSGKGDEARKLIPEEFWGTFDSFAEKLNEKFKDSLYEYSEQYSKVAAYLLEGTRKIFAHEVQKLDKKYQSFCFSFFKDDEAGREIRSKILWETAYPKGNVFGYWIRYDSLGAKTPVSESNKTH